MSSELSKKLDLLCKAANHLRQAAAALAAIRLTQDQYLHDDALFMVAQVDSMLSADNGEAGLDALIRRVQSKLEK
jgi:hypothetical protein